MQWRKITVQHMRATMTFKALIMISYNLFPMQV